MLLDGQTPDGGEMFLSKATKFGYLEQHIGLESERNVYDELLTIFSHITDIEDQIKELTGAIDAGIADGADAANRLHQRPHI